MEGNLTAARILLLVTILAEQNVATTLVDRATAAHEADAVEGGQTTALVLAVGGVRKHRVLDTGHHLASAADPVLVTVSLELAALVGFAFEFHWANVDLSIAAHLLEVGWLRRVEG